MEPLYPPGHSLDAMTVFNFPVKMKQLLAKSPGDPSTTTITERDEATLLSTVENEAFTLLPYLENGAK